MPVRLMFATEGGSGGTEGGEGTGETETVVEEPVVQETNDDLVPRAELAKVNREAAKYRVRAKEAETKLQEREDADKTELERTKGRVSTLEASNQELMQENRRLRAVGLAEKVGITASARADAVTLLDWSSMTDTSDPAEVEGALRELVRTRPYLLGGGRPGADGGAGNTDKPETMNDILRGKR
jgi:hypothetical protein